MNAERDFKRFLIVGAMVVAGGVTASAALVAVVDPYRLYRSIEMDGFNSVKPLPTRYQNRIKMHGALEHRPNTFILGNSRAELGLNPEHAALGASAYNLALAGSGLSTSRDQLDQLRSEGVKPKRLVIGLEFLDFLLDPSKPPPVRKAKPKDWFDELSWEADLLFSMDSIVDSLKTLRLQRLSDPQSITERGFNPLREYNKFARDGGYYPIFQQRAVENAKRFVRAPRGLIYNATQLSPDLDDLRAILALGARSRADVNLVIYPYHAQILAMFEEAGLASTFDEWKALMIREVEQIRAAYPGVRITLWDFSGFSSYQCEPIPAKGDKATKTKWYWEAGHFKPALGDLILWRILGDDTSPDNFGFVLDQATAADNRIRMASERAACAAAQPGIFEDARRLISSARASSGALADRIHQP